MELKEIDQFNPALIYCLDPEASYLYTDPQTVEYLFNGVGQYNDMYQAYLYAQESILSTIEKIGLANITGDHLVEWLNQIHLRIAKTLGNNFNAPAGEFSKQQVFRWQPDNTVQVVLQCYLSGKFDTLAHIKELTNANFFDISVIRQALEIFNKSKTKSKEMMATSFALAMLQTLQIDQDIAIGLVKLLDRIHTDETIQVAEDQKPFISSVSQKDSAAISTLLKLAMLYQTNKLTPEEKSVVDKVVKICISPTQYPQEIKKFAQDLVKSWQICNKDNLDDVAALATKAFYEITEIHPYFNGNGRLATCAMNIILRSLGKPSILMRHPMERNDPKSSYSQAIKSINSNSDLLFQHIKNRIKETEAQGDYVNKSLLVIINARINLSKVISQIMVSFPSYDINNSLKYAYSTMPDFFKDSTSENIDKCQLKAITSLTQFCEKLLETLNQKNVALKSKVPDVIHRAYNPEETTKVIKKLEEMTNQTGWKSYKKNGLTILLNLEEDKVAQQCVTKLNETGALKAELKRNAETKKPVVFLDSINLEKLDAIKPLKGIEKPIINLKFKRG